MESSWNEFESELSSPTIRPARTSKRPICFPMYLKLSRQISLASLSVESLVLTKIDPKDLILFETTKIGVPGSNVLGSLRLYYY